MASEKYVKRVANIQKWIKDYITNLKGMENFGHLFERHLNHPDEKMMRSCAHEKCTITSFTGSEEAIVEAIKSLLLTNCDEIVEWLADDSDNEDWILYGDLSDFDIQGKCYLNSPKHNWKEGPKECSEFVVVLTKKRSKKRLEFLIKSSYPIY